MLYWECKRRLKSLQEFRNLVVDYFQDITYQPWPHHHLDPVENDIARRVRVEINRHIPDVQYSCLLVGESFTFYYHPPPAIGGPAGDINILRNIFDLQQFEISPSRIIDSLDRAIGNYERRKSRLFKQIFNPFYWLRLALERLLSVPFKILEIAGVSEEVREKIERSFVSKLLKALVGSVGFVAAFLAILHYVGWLQGFLEWIARVIDAFRHPTSTPPTPRY